MIDKSSVLYMPTQCITHSPQIKPEQQSDEDARNDNISQPQHGKVLSSQTILQQVLWEHQFNGCFKRFSNSEHHICTKYPKDIVDEESSKQDAACADPVKSQKLYTVDREGQAKQVVGYPVLRWQGGEDGMDFTLLLLLVQ